MACQSEPKPRDVLFQIIGKLTTDNVFEKSCHVIMGFCAVYSILTNWTNGGNLSKRAVNLCYVH